MTSSTNSASSRTLVAPLVYGGAEFVPACVESAARLTASGDVDVLVLDDCSPDEHWSGELQTHCAGLGVGYYRGPRNLGIPRNMNLTLRRAVTGGYGYVVIANSDVIFPSNLVTALRGAARTDPSIASVTAWSNHVSSFSLENADSERNLGSAAGADHVSELLEASFGDRCLDVPVGVGFCMLIPVDAIRRVGLFDPIFGRGYCEEVDWCLRAQSYGLRNVLSAGVFVYHIGNASTTGAGMLKKAATSVAEHEAIIDLRYPRYRQALQVWIDQGLLDSFRAEASQALVRAGVDQDGYVLEISTIESVRVSDLGTFVVDSNDRVRKRPRLSWWLRSQVRCE